MQINVINVPSGIDNYNVPYDFVTNFLNLIVTQSATNSTFLDDSIVAATNFVPIGMTGYYGAQISVTSGTHIITFTMSDGYRDSTNAATVTLTTGDPGLYANYETVMTGTNQSLNITLTVSNPLNCTNLVTYTILNLSLIHICFGMA